MPSFLSSLAGLEELAKCPNVYAKVSGMFATDPKWDQQSVEDVVKPVLEIFGIDRLVFEYRASHSGMTNSFKVSNEFCLASLLLT